MEIKTGTFNFPPGTGERTARLSFVFSHPLTEAHVAMCGYRAEYVKADRAIQRLVVRLSTEIGGRVDDGWVATVVARFNLRDQNEEHPFSGAIDFVLFAEIQEFAPEPAFAIVANRREVDPLDPVVPKAAEAELRAEDEIPSADEGGAETGASESAADEDSGSVPDEETDVDAADLEADADPEEVDASEAETDETDGEGEKTDHGPADVEAAEADEEDPVSAEGETAEREQTESPATEEEE